MKTLIRCGYLLLVLNTSILGQNAGEPLHLLRIDAPITMDGIIDEPVWQTISALPMTTHWPEFGNKPGRETEIKVAYNDEFLYFSAVCKDTTGNIQSPFFKRDQWGLSMDQVGLIIDSYDDNENGLIFVITPSASRIDVTVQNDAGQGGINVTWDTFWDAKTSWDEQGWNAEVRIPLSSLKFQVIDDEVSMGMLAYRYRPEDASMDIYPAVPPDWGFWSFVKPSQAQTIKLKNIKSKKPLYVSPYLLTGGAQELEVNVSNAEHKYINDTEFEAGLDVKYSISDNVTMDFSVNTDFAQVEADNAQVNLTRFSLFFPERRRFFLERQSNFDFRFDNDGQLFYSRRIGLNDGGKVRLLGGARMVARVGKWDVGILNMQTGKKDDISSENFGVYRFKRRVINPFSYLGGIATTRISANGYYNLGYGIDGVFRLFDQDFLTTNIAQTLDQELDNAPSDLNSSRLKINWERRSFAGLSYLFEYQYSGAQYNPGIGFQARDDFKKLGSEVRWGWTPGENSKIQRTQINLRSNAFYTNEGNALQSLELGPSLQTFFKKGDNWRTGLMYLKENLLSAFDLSDDASIAPGQYDFVNLSLSYGTPNGGLLRANFDTNLGTFYDGTRISFGIRPNWSISKYLELSGFYQYNQINFEDRNQEFIAHVAQFKVQASLNTKFEVASFIQFNSQSKQSLINFRLRYNQRDGNDFYLVYNEGGNTDRNRYDFEVPIATQRAILAKYIYTFRL